MPKMCSPSNTVAERAATAEKRYMYGEAIGLAPQAIIYYTQGIVWQTQHVEGENGKSIRLGLKKMTRPCHQIPR